jgi:photosystem II stability/assembly factor-like uncharacterized protein
METLLIGYTDGLVRTSINGSADGEWVMRKGPVQMLAADPGQPDRVYAATLGQGIWRSVDAGRSFEHLPGLAAELIWSIAVSASDRHNGLGTIYAGTQMSAVYKSIDGGETFEELKSVQEIPSLPEWSFPPAPDTHHVHQITLDTSDPATILFGVELGGVYRSVDGGEHWTLTDADPDPHTLRTHPTEPKRMYQGGGAGYCESRDAGATWRRDRDLTGIPDEVRYFFSLAVDSGDPDNVIISGARDPFSGHAVPIPGISVWSSLYRLTGDTWEEVVEGLPAQDGTAMGTLAAGGPGVFYYVTEPGDVYRSHDGGRSFASIEYDKADLRGDKARSAIAIDV